MNPTTATWATETGVARARELWDAGTLTVDIGRAVGCSRDAIVGYARRHHWPPHPHPPRGGSPPGVSKPRKPLEPQQKAPRQHIRTRPIPKPPRPVVAPEPPVPVYQPRSCQWPFGEPRTRGFRLCEATPVVEGKPYCRAHSEIAYHRASRWHAEAVA